MHPADLDLNIKPLFNTRHRARFANPYSEHPGLLMKGTLLQQGRVLTRVFLYGKRDALSENLEKHLKVARRW